MSLFVLNRFRNITREGIKAMLDFDILDTVAGRLVYDEGLEKDLKKDLKKVAMKDLKKVAMKGLKRDLSI